MGVLGRARVTLSDRFHHTSCQPGRLESTEPAPDTGALRRHGSPARPSGGNGTVPRAGPSPFPPHGSGPGPRRRLSPRGGALASVYCAASGAASSLPQELSSGRSFPPSSTRLRSRSAPRGSGASPDFCRLGAALGCSAQAFAVGSPGVARRREAGPCPSPAHYKSAAAVGPECRRRLLTVRARSRRRLTVRPERGGGHGQELCERGGPGLPRTEGREAAG